MTDRGLSPVQRELLTVRRRLQGALLRVLWAPALGLCAWIAFAIWMATIDVAELATTPWRLMFGLAAGALVSGMLVFVAAGLKQVFRARRELRRSELHRRQEAWTAPEPTTERWIRTKVLAERLTAWVRAVDPELCVHVETLRDDVRVAEARLQALSVTLGLAHDSDRSAISAEMVPWERSAAEDLVQLTELERTWSEFAVVLPDHAGRGAAARLVAHAEIELAVSNRNR